ncbi:MAG: two-component regulator propeller domain-containing protein [Bacteroidota bacterium]|nr:two-component regulator propeller domain-containing protein [Bacteroidota bacterium]
MKKTLLGILALLFFFHVDLISQQVKNFPSLTGKKDVPANCITQTEEGYIWFGTNEGLVRFDGKKTKVYTKEDGLNSSEISALYQSTDKTLWIGHKNGKISFIKNLSTGKAGKDVDTFKLNPNLTEEKITGFYQSNNGTLWISTYGNGLYSYKNNLLAHYTTKEGLGDDLIYNMCADDKNKLWLGTDAGITMFDPEGSINQKSFSTLTSKNGLPDNIVRSICYNGSDQMIIAMQDSGICFYNLKKREIQRKHFFKEWNYGAIDGVEYIKQRNEIVFVTEKKGLFSIKEGRITVYDQSNGVLTNELNGLFIDREYNIWLASTKGVTQIFEQRHSFFTTQNNLPSNSISAVVAESDNTVWLASDKGLSQIMQNETGGFEVKSAEIKELKGNQVVCIMYDNKKRIWLGTYGAGIVVYNKETKKSFSVNSKSGLCNDNISNIIQEKNGNIWVSTLGGGVCKLTEEADSKFIIKTYNEENGLGSSYVYQCFFTKKNEILLAVDGAGLQKIENDKVITLSENLKSKTVYSIVEDEKGKIWFTTSDDGIICYDRKNFTSYTTKNGLRDPQPPVLAVVKEKILLIHSKGIDVINSNDPKDIRLFDVSENDIDPNLNAFFKDRNGQLWIATNNGLLRYRAEDNFYDTITPKAFITGFKVQYLDHSVDSVSNFDHNQNSMIFEFSAILLKSPDKIHFRYMLKGSDKNWMYAMGSNMAAYNSLDPGTYEFLVEASNEEGLWGPPTSYKFTIASPIWLKWWFWLIIIGALVATVYLFLQYRLRALQKEKMILEQKVEERTAEIKEQTKIIEEKNVELEQLSLVASKTDNIVLILDPAGKLEFVNESFTKVNRMTFNELIEKHGETIFEISNNPRIKEIVQDCINKKQSVVYESVNTKVAGEEIWESSTLTPIYDEQGVLKKLIIIDTDITERKKQERIILQKNKDITDSIEYAQKIQRAILPNEAEIKKSIPHSFIFYLMKDIVSGDFYWFTEKDDFSIIAAIDCTGHGVPGAFMSLIGYNLLNQIVNEKCIHEPAKILQELNEGVIQALYKNNPGNQNKDGMDLALCKIYKNKKTVEYAGAMRPLWIVSKDGELNEVRPTKMPIGSLPSAGYIETEYVNNSIDCKEGDTLYIFTDGYADQFGGEKSKKFTTGKLKQLFVSIKDENMEVQKEILHDVHLAWKGEQEQVDDILVIGFKF